MCPACIMNAAIVAAGVISTGGMTALFLKKKGEIKMAQNKTENHKVVSQPEWVAAREKYLSKEKEFTRLRDELSRQRRELPWVKSGKGILVRYSGRKEDSV